MDYRDFIHSRRFQDSRNGIRVEIDQLTPSLKPHQKYVCKWALAKGRAAAFMDTGLGKSRLMCEWAKFIPGRVIILSPLFVAHQTVREASHVGLPLEYSRFDNGAPYIITNYEMVGHFDLSKFTGVVLDESSILKNYDGGTRAALTAAVQPIPYRLSCSATPSPNDHMELGTQAEFLGVMNRNEMLAMFFTHDSGNTSQWILKGHAKDRFWEWMSTWSVFIRSPTDLGFDGREYDLPPLQINNHVLPFEGPIASTLTERRIAKKQSLDLRIRAVAAYANCISTPLVIWCQLNDESKKLVESIPESVEITGSDKPDKKEQALIDFSEGRVRIIVTKPEIAGFGVNWQHCNHTIFAGLNDSFEKFYQSIRRFYRFGQTQPVTVDCFLASTEVKVLENLKRKESQHKELSDKLSSYMIRHMQSEVLGTIREQDENYGDQIIQMPEFL